MGVGRNGSRTMTINDNDKHNLRRGLMPRRMLAGPKCAMQSSAAAAMATSTCISKTDKTKFINAKDYLCNIQCAVLFITNAVVTLFVQLPLELPAQHTWTDEGSTDHAGSQD